MKGKACLWIAALGTLGSSAEDVPYGVEFLGGIRSGYHQRGMRLSNDLIDLQLQSRLTLEDAVSVNMAIWRAAEASGDFNEFGALASISREYGEYSVAFELAYHSYDSEKVESGLEASALVDYSLTDHTSVYGSVSSNTAVQNLYAQVGWSGSHKVSKDSYIQVKSELHMAQNYFGREGLYDLTSRLNYTYNISEMMSLTPFLSSSIPLDDKEDFNLSTGVWVEVFF